MGFILRVLVVALGLWLASVLVPGIRVEDGWTLLGAALLLGIVNALVRRLIVILTLPITRAPRRIRAFGLGSAIFGWKALFEDFEGSSVQESRLGCPGKGVTSAAICARAVELRPLSPLCGRGRPLQEGKSADVVH